MDTRTRTGLALVCLLLGTIGAALPAGGAERAPDGALVGLRGVFQTQPPFDGLTTVVRVDPATAVDTPLGGEIAGLAGLFAGESTFDAAGRRLIFMGVDDADVDRLYVIDAQTGALISSPALPAPAAGTRVSLDALEYGRAGGSLLAMRGIFEDQPPFTRLSRRLVRVDLGTAAQTPVGGEIPGQAFFSLGESTFDDAGRRLIFPGADDARVERLYVVDAQTGALLASPALPAPPAGQHVFLNAFEFDQASGSLLAMRGIFDASFNRLSRRLVRVDPMTAAQTPVGGEIPGQARFSAGDSSFDAAGRRLIFEGLDDLDVARLYVIDAQSGALLASPAIPGPPAGQRVSLSALEYDALATTSLQQDPTVSPTPTITTPPAAQPMPASVVLALAELRRALRADARSAKKMLKRLGIEGLLERGRFAIRGFDALTAGTLRVALTTRGAAATRAAARKRLLARAKRSFDEPGRYRVTVKLTRKGKRILGRSRRRAATLALAFSDPSGRTVRRSKKVTLRR